MFGGLERVCVFRAIVKSGFADGAVEASNVGSGLLPAGEEHKQPLYTRTEPSMMLQHSVLAVLNAELGDTEETMAESTILGFVYVYVEPAHLPDQN